MAMDAPVADRATDRGPAYRRRLLPLLATATSFNGYDGFLLPFGPSLNLAMLTVAQFVAQVFLGSEWAVAVTIVVEEFPTNDRGRGLGILIAMLTLGGILVGILAFAGLASTPLSWRAFYLVGLIPLAVVALLRRRMHETARYSAVRAADNDGGLNHT